MYPIWNLNKCLWLFTSSILLVISLSCASEIDEDIRTKHIKQDSIVDVLPIPSPQVTVASTPLTTTWQKKQTYEAKTELHTSTTDVIQLNNEFNNDIDVGPDSIYRNEFPAAPDRDLYKLSSELSGDKPISQNTELEVNLTIGSVSKFWL